MARQPDAGPASLLEELRSLRRRVDRLEGASPLTGSGMSVPAAGVLKVTGRLDVAGGLSYSSAWGSAVAYRAGQLVVEPGGTLVTSKADHTSGNAFNPANWTSATTPLDGRYQLASALARRGGQFSSPANALAVGTVTYVTLSQVSGDMDLVNAGNLVVPTGAGGLWAVTAVWIMGGGQSSNRVFLDINVNNSAAIYRANVGYLEDRVTATVVLPFAAADVLRFAVYASPSGAYTTGTTVNAYRIGV